MDSKNLWIYSSPSEIEKTSSSLISFGITQYKSAKFISELSKLEEIVNTYNGPIPFQIHQDILLPILLSSLMDNIRIIIFFENYMKAQLLLNGFMVHKVLSTSDKYKEIKREQKKRPISTNELHDIKPFSVNQSEKKIDHEALSFLTLGIKDLINKDSYKNLYQFDNELFVFLKQINKDRNKLHFLNSLNFRLSKKLVANLKKVDAFVNSLSSIK